jgi:hypothetical protein
MAATARASLKKKRKKGETRVKIINILFTVFLIAVILVLGFFLACKYLFKVENISIKTDGRYSDEEILKASGIKVGQELYGFDVGQAKENIKDTLTYSDSVIIYRRLFSTVCIEVKTEEGFFGILLGGDYYIISKSFRVVDRIKVVGNNGAGSEFKPPAGIITVETYEIRKCYMGEKIEFKDDDIFDVLKDITELADDNIEMISSLNCIDIKNKFKVYMNYQDRLLLRFGVFENISAKLLNSFEVITQIPDDAEGIIDMTNEKMASFRYEENALKLYKNGKTGLN